MPSAAPRFTAGTLSFLRRLKRNNRREWFNARREEYERDIDLVHLAAELVVDAIVEPEDLRAELIARLSAAAGKDRTFSRRRHGVTPV